MRQLQPDRNDLPLLPHFYLVADNFKVLYAFVLSSCNRFSTLVVESVDIPETSYKYARLPPLHLRLIRLQSSLKDDGPLHFSFWIRSVHQARGEYDAISYTWGSPDFTKTISCEDDHGGDTSDLPITDNCFKALKRFRHRLDERFLWADAICINQKDNDEKALQIPMMDKIYRGAHQVVAWLGDGGEKEERVLRGFALLAGAPKGKPDYRDAAQIANLLPQFFAIPWFRRLWIVQEAILNTDLKLFCGKMEISWSKFVLALDILGATQHWDGVKALPGTIAVVKTITVWKQYGSGSDATNLDIIYLIEQASYHECGNARDRIFALYSIASDMDTESLNTDRVTMFTRMVPSYDTKERDLISMPVDYNADIKETYTRFAAACLGSRSAWEFLLSVWGRIPQTTGPSWPSWVPDWRLPPKRGTMELRHEMIRSPKNHPFIKYLGRETADRVRLRIYSGVYIVARTYVAQRNTTLHRFLEWSVKAIIDLQTVYRTFWAKHVLPDNYELIPERILQYTVAVLCLASDNIGPGLPKDAQGQPWISPNYDKWKKRHWCATPVPVIDSMLSEKSAFVASFPISRRSKDSDRENFVAMGFSAFEMREDDKFLRIPTRKSQKIPIVGIELYPESALVLRLAPGTSPLSYYFVGDATLYWGKGGMPCYANNHLDNDRWFHRHSLWNVVPEEIVIG